MHLSCPGRVRCTRHPYRTRGYQSACCAHHSYPWGSHQCTSSWDSTVDKLLRLLRAKNYVHGNSLHAAFSIHIPSSQEQSHVGRSQVCRATHELRQFICNGVQAVLVHHQANANDACFSCQHFFSNNFSTCPESFVCLFTSFTLSWEWRRVALPLSSGVTCERRDMSADGCASQHSSDRNQMKSWNLQ